jgi:hypothetical protein
LASYSTFPNRKGFGESKETYVKEEVSEWRSFQFSRHPKGGCSSCGTICTQKEITLKEGNIK